MKKVKVREVAWARTGDKGDINNVHMHPYNEADFPMIREQLTAERVKRAYRGLVKGEVKRYEYPKLKILNFVLYQALGGGVSRSIALDPHGKSWASILLEMDVQVPDNWIPDRSMNK